MRNHQPFRALLMGFVVLGLACGGPLDTGTAKAPAKNKPTATGACPAAQTACGVGAFAWCADLLTAPEHCGTCERSCSPGIACQAGVCQQTACTSSTSPFSGTRNSGQPDFVHSHGQTFADVNGDAWLDLVEWRVEPGQNLDTFSVSLGQPSGGVAAAETYQAGFEIANIQGTNHNDDGADDLFVFTQNVFVEGPARMEVWLGHRDGHLTRARDNDLTGADVSDRSRIAFGDISGDGWADVVSVSQADMHTITVFLSDSTGAVHPTATYRTGGVAVYAILIRDWNGDGRPDLVVMNGRGLEILHNRGDGTFEQPLACSALLPVVGGLSVLAEDFNHDGLTDLAFNGNPIRVVLRQTECGFFPVSVYDVPVPMSVPQAMGDNLAGGGVPILRAADMNGDGQLDLVVTFNVVYNRPLIVGEGDPNFTPSVDADTFLSVLLGKPDGTFQLQDTVISLGSGTITDLAIREGTGDKRPDVVVSSSDGQVRVWENTCQ